jgi:hypothetical protein
MALSSLLRRADMLKTKQPPKKDWYPLAALSPGIDGRSPLERRLLAFLDTFNVYLFLYEPSYRRRLNDMLERFTDEEFEDFTRIHFNRFTVN